MKKFIILIFICSIGCTSIISSKSYIQAVREYNKDYRVLKIMPDDKFIVVVDKNGQIKVLAIDKITKEVKNEYSLKEK